jgi:hypothetical protein
MPLSGRWVAGCGAPLAGIGLGQRQVLVFRVVLLLWSVRALGDEPRYGSPPALRIMMWISLFLIRPA